MRPANIVTAFADVLAGASAAAGSVMIAGDYGYLTQPALIGLLISTFGLYGGGIVFNDVFDAELDKKERPERTIPSGRVSKLYASILGTLLFFMGIVSAFWVNLEAGLLAITIALGALLYDSKAKHHLVFGPLVMGSCRGGNLLLGAALIPASLSYLWPLAFIPIVYIASITLISQGEVHGGSKSTGLLATFLVASVTGVLLLLSILEEYTFVYALPFAILFGVMVLPAFVSAAFEPVPGKIKTAVKRGVISLIILNSTLAAGFAGLIPGLFVLALLPLSFWFSKLFAVT
jgi:4-hydroxybenzoate polyprenyltransferase